ncbi:MAG: M28 family peptidase [Proteobacteria bacterium]|nr:M28 family peptidase [Pseudomonadota bacterium]
MTRFAPLLFALACQSSGTLTPDDHPDEAPPDVNPVDLVSTTSYERSMEELLYTHLGENRGFGPEHDLARDNIATEFETYGLDVALEPFTYQGATYHNVVATQLGTSRPDEVLVIGAHFDSVDNPGADDNATGTAMVLEVARVLSQYESAVTLHYVAFDREEQGKVGSRAFVAAHADEAIQFALTADMIGQDHGGYAMDLFSTTASVPLASDFSRAIDTHGNGLSGRLQTGDYSFSDHWSFEEAGIPAFVIIEADYSGNPHYHQSTDAADLVEDYIDYVYVGDLLRAVVGFVAEEAEVRSR